MSAKSINQIGGLQSKIDEAHSYLRFSNFNDLILLPNLDIIR